MAQRKRQIAGWRKVLDDFLKNFEIDSKESGRTVLKPWGTQTQVLDELGDGMDFGVRFFVIGKGRQYGVCLDPATRVLTADLRWVRIDSLKIGDRVVSVQEETPKKQHGREMRTGVVQGVVVVRHKAFKIHFDDGRSVICTGKHPWLSVNIAQGTHQRWRSIEDRRQGSGHARGRLRVGCRIRWITRPWEDMSLEDAWFGGMLDGEGSLDVSRSVRANVAQREGPVWNRLVKYAVDRGYHVNVKPDKAERSSKFGKEPVPKLEFGRMDEILRLVGQTRPTRFIGKEFWVGRELPGKSVGAGWATITEIEQLPEQDFIDLQTSEGTYIAEGFVSHNTTILVPVDVLWALMHPGIEGAIIGHKPDVTEVCRAQINDMQARVPEELRVPLVTNNKDKVEWEFRDGTRSTINLLVAGTTGRKTDLAKGHGLSFIHGTEVGEWGSETALNSLIASLAQKNPDRLYMFESTGEGNNLFARLYRKSENHPNRRTIFVHWWEHDLYKLDKRTRQFAHYMANPLPTEDEREIIKAAKAAGHDLTDAELAWYRSMSDEMTSVADMRKNYPSVPDDMFQLGGAAFFPLVRLNAAKSLAEEATHKSYRITTGSDIAAMSITEMGAGDYNADLLVWEEPKPRGRYVIAAKAGDGDGSNAVIQVIRCFADCVEQVAEFASDEIEPYQVAWVVAYLAGWYKDSWVNIELEDGGRNIFRELKNMRDQVSLGKIGQDGIFGSMVFYLYQRIDNASGNARTYHWVTNATNEAEIWIDLKDSFLTKRCIIHSEPCLAEMAMVTQDKDGIGGDNDCEEGRPFTMCVAIRTWVDSVRLGMIADGQMRDAELRRDVGAAPATFLENIVNQFVRREQNRIEGEREYRR